MRSHGLRPAQRGVGWHHYDTERGVTKRIGQYDKPAGGWDSLLSSLKAVQHEGIVARGGRTMLRANQPEGFDCPGCAWPEPREVDGGRRRAAEFCENGANRRLSPGLTTRRV